MGIGARGIIRLSGPNVLAILSSFFRLKNHNSLENGFVSLDVGTALTCILHGELYPWRQEWGTTGPSVPCDLYYWGPGHGFTGQASVELHLPGNPPLLERIITVLCETGKVRLAEHGEFTLRAFLSGRIDLTQAEAVLGIIDASDEQEMNTALDQLAGGVRLPLMELRRTLLNALADLEAGLDFSDTDNNEIVFITSGELLLILESALRTIIKLQKQMTDRTGRSGIPTVVLWGPPNSGKSSLFNALVERYSTEAEDPKESIPRALVSAQPGTTRDYLEYTFKTNDLIWRLIDTAGLFQNVDSLHEIDLKAQAITKNLMDRACLSLYCHDILSDKGNWNGGYADIPESFGKKKFLSVVTKSDLLSLPEEGGGGDNGLESGCNTDSFITSSSIVTSSKRGWGLDLLIHRIETSLREEYVHSEVVASTANRCRESLRQAREGLETARSLLSLAEDDVLVAAELRRALDHIGLIVGTVHSDDILDRIFSRFCIGK